MIKLFVFDLGNVILPFNHVQIADKLSDCQKNRTFCPQDIFDYIFDFEKGSINGYEEGHCSSMEFFQDIRDRYKLDVEFDAFKEIWNNIFWENLEVNEMIVYLKAKGYPIFLLSNTNELHFTHIIERYPIVHVMDEWILSFEIGAKKPQQRIYDAIFEKMDVSRDEVFYIDDVEPYVQSARYLGMNGMVFTQPADLWDIIRNSNF
jgi:putative hydrolase of the HAD superfamily